MEGLLQSQLYDVANQTLQNFMDELDQFGFIPNGGRIYCMELSSPRKIFRLTFHRFEPVTTTRVHPGKKK